ncbi:hypothetical protein YC2023_041444 [Brassica napus]
MNLTDLVVPNTGDDKKISLWRIDVNILAVLVAMKDNGDKECKETVVTRILRFWEARIEES